MIGLGTLINVGGILAGGLIGLAFGKSIGKRAQETLTQAVAVSCLFVGMAGAFEKMLVLHADGRLASAGTLMMIVSFALGAVVGELLDIEAWIERLGAWLKAKTGSQGDAGFVGAFVTASLTVCIGAMAVVGSIKDGIEGDCSILTAKALMDLIIITVMTASLGKGCVFSAIPVALFQGAVTLAARGIEPLMTPQALANLSLTGSMLIFCVGVNLLWNMRIHVANLLPTLVFAVAWAFLPASWL